MRHNHQIDYSKRRGERGVTILLVVFGMSFLILAIASLAIDVASLYVANDEAKYAANAGALAGAKVFANSGMTSDSSVLPAAIEPIATAVATAVATQNKIGSAAITGAQVTVTFPNAASADFTLHPQVQVSVQRADLPTFFARIWGTKFVLVKATATAEAYNPSNASLAATPTPPVSPQCVKPWVLPNKDPNAAGTNFFDKTTGAPATASGQVGKLLSGLQPACSAGTCDGTVTAGHFYYAELTDPTPAPTCRVTSCVYEDNIEGCSPEPISCNGTITVEKSTTCGGSRKGQTDNGIKCLIHADSPGLGNGQDCLNLDAVGSCNAGAPSAATNAQVFAGSDNLVVKNGLGVAQGDQITTSDSLVTVPVYDSSTGVPNFGGSNTVAVNVVGFIQGFVTDYNPSGSTGHIDMRIVNLVGCGSATTSAANPVLGDGMSPVPVRLVSP